MGQECGWPALPPDVPILGFVFFGSEKQGIEEPNQGFISHRFQVRPSSTPNPQSLALTQHFLQGFPWDSRRPALTQQILQSSSVALLGLILTHRVLQGSTSFVPPRRLPSPCGVFLGLCFFNHWSHFLKKNALLLHLDLCIQEWILGHSCTQTQCFWAQIAHRHM